VQDWFYWKEDTWGSHEFDKTRFPDPGWVGPQIHEKARRHDLGVGQVLSGTKNFEAMRSQGSCTGST